MIRYIYNSFQESCIFSFPNTAFLNAIKLKLNQMKKLIAIALMVIFSFPFIKAQESTFDLNDVVVNIGIGLGTSYGIGLYNKSIIPPLSISVEKGILDDVLEKGVIGVGAYVGFNSYKWHYVYSTYDWGYRYTNIIIGGRGSFHYPIVDKLDTYVGVILGYRVSIATEFGDVGGYDYSSDSGGIAYSGFVGGRYYFSDKFSGFAELGYGIAYLTLGLGIKL